MQPLISPEGAVDQFALVAYVPAPLGPYLDAMRRRLAPWMPPGRAHVTLLPPRPLNGNADRVWRRIGDVFSGASAFDVAMGEVGIFHSTDVIFLNVDEGSGLLHRFHETLNQGDSAFTEPFDYHPHVTLAQGLPSGDAAEALVQARDLWSRYEGPRCFRLDRIYFVQNTVLNLWMDLAEVRLSSDGR